MMHQLGSSLKCLIACGVCLLPAVAVRAQNPPDQVGTWETRRETVQQAVVSGGPHAPQGRILGDVTFSPDAPHAWSLDGKTNRMVLADDITLLDLPVRALSVEAWVLIDRTQEWGGIVGALQDNGSFERGWLLGFRGSRFCLGLASAGPRRMTYLTADKDFVPGCWYHVVGTYDGSAMNLFVDGRRAATSPDQSGEIIYPDHAVFEIGAYHDDDELYPVAGQIAHVRVDRQAWHADTVTERFQARKSGFPGVDPIVTAPVTGWPTYRHDELRSGRTAESLAFPLAAAWIHESPYAPSPAWPPPAKQDFWHSKQGLPARVVFDRAFHVVSDGDAVYFGSSAEDSVQSLDLETGAIRWQFTTEGPVRLAPTIDNGRVYFGSDDGVVYCLSAADGSLIWTCRAVENDRRIPGNGRIISTWPVRTGVMIRNGQARFAAGLFPNQGTYQFAVDAVTGERLAEGPITFSPQGYLQRRGSSIMVPQGRAGSAQVSRITSIGKIPVSPVVDKPADSVIESIAAGQHQIDGGNGTITARDPQGQVVWQFPVSGRVYSLAVAGGRLLASTDRGFVYCFEPADSIETADPAVVHRAPEPDAGSTDDGTEQLAGDIVERTHSDQGYALVLGGNAGPLAVALASHSRLNTIGFEEDEGAVQSARRAIRHRRLAGRVAMHRGDRTRLPYAPALFNLVVWQPLEPHRTPTLDAKTLRSLVRPEGGILLVGVAGDNARPELLAWAQELDAREIEVAQWGGAMWLTLVRRPLPGAGEWTHMYANPANTSCSDDLRVSGELGIQWFGRPGPELMLDRHHRTVPPLYSSGRMFIPGNDQVFAVDAYNGTVLWQSEVAASRRVAAMRDAGSMTATREYLYIAALDRCYGLDSQTGEKRLNLVVPNSPDGQPRHWGMVAHVGDALYGSATRPGASRGGHSRQQINETFWDFVPVVTSDSVFSMNRHTGALTWRYDARRGAILNPTITMAEGKAFFVESKNPASLDESSGRSKLTDLLGRSGAELVALNTENGQVLWRAELPELQSIEHHLYLCYAAGRLFAIGSNNQEEGGRKTVWFHIHAFGASDGAKLWTASQNQGQGINGDHGEQDHHPAIVGNTLFVEPRAYDIGTGKLVPTWQFARGGHGCGALSASASAIFFRAGNPTMCDLATGEKRKVTQVSRPGCWINIIPAGGLLLIPEASSGCSCDFPIQSSMALMPAASAR